MKNILLEKSKKYLPKKIKSTSKTFFDDEKGYWILNRTGEPLVLSNVAKKLSTKKEDIETGEDQKGE